MKRKAQCHCGNLAVLCEGEPEHVVMCHCELCQRRTGTAFNLAAWFPASAVEIAGDEKTYTRVGVLGIDTTFHFCPNCGSNVYWRTSVPDMIGVAVGCFADPEFRAPSVSIYDSQRHSWLIAPEGIPTFEGNGEEESE